MANETLVETIAHAEHLAKVEIVTEPGAKWSEMDTLTIAVYRHSTVSHGWQHVADFYPGSMSLSEDLAVGAALNLFNRLVAKS